MSFLSIEDRNAKRKPAETEGKSRYLERKPAETESEACNEKGIHDEDRKWQTTIGNSRY